MLPFWNDFSRKLQRSIYCLTRYDDIEKKVHTLINIFYRPTKLMARVNGRHPLLKAIKIHSNYNGMICVLKLS